MCKTTTKPIKITLLTNTATGDLKYVLVMIINMIINMISNDNNSKIVTYNSKPWESSV